MSLSDETAPMGEGVHLRWPPERFLWAHIDPRALHGLRSGVRSTERLGLLAEPQLPCSLEEVHLEFQELADGSLMVCALPVAEIELIAPGVLTLSPSELPACAVEVLRGREMDPEGWNLLSGPWTPERVKALRESVWREGVLAILVALGLVIAGLEVRRIQLLGGQEAAHNARTALLDRELPAEARNPLLPLELQLATYLRTLERTRHPAVVSTVGPSATERMAGLLAAWPRQPVLDVQTESLVVHPESITLRAVVPDDKSADRLSQALDGAVDGWVRGMPRIERLADGVRIALQWRPHREGRRP